MKTLSFPLPLFLVLCLAPGCLDEAAGPNLMPVAIAGPDIKVQMNTTAQLDGRQSYDPDGAVRWYLWQLASAPPDHQNDLQNATLSQAQLKPDKPGAWIVRLEVSDGELRSLPDVIQVLALAGCDAGQDGASCDDGIYCTVNDVCIGGACQGTPRDCDDGDSCTLDECSDNPPQCRHTLQPNPGAEGPAGGSTCADQIDNDCDQLTDENDPDCLNTCRDLDGDGYGDPGNSSCPNGAARDCDDNPAACGTSCHPGAAETCDGWDNDCDGLTDENDNFPNWWNTQWYSRRKLTFDNSGQASALGQFPVLVILDPTQLDFGKLRADGTDLRFIASDNTTELAYHLEGWSTAGNNFVWVLVPSIAAGSDSDFIWMYYHNPSALDVQDPAATYDANFVGVWHLNEVVQDEQTGAIHVDSTSHQNNGAQNKNAQTPGKIGNGQAFDGADDYIRIRNAAELNLTNAWTIEAWINPTQFGWSYQALISKDCNNDFGETLRGASLWLNQDRAQVWYTPGGAHVTSKDKLRVGQWTYLAATFNGSQLNLFINGSLDTSLVTEAPDTNAFDLYFGQRGENTSQHYWYHGLLDEVRLSNNAREPGWIKAQYLSMNNDFVTFGDEENNCP